MNKILEANVVTDKKFLDEARRVYRDIFNYLRSHRWDFRTGGWYIDYDITEVMSKYRNLYGQNFYLRFTYVCSGKGGFAIDQRTEDLYFIFPYITKQEHDKFWDDYNQSFPSKENRMSCGRAITDKFYNETKLHMNHFIHEIIHFLDSYRVKGKRIDIVGKYHKARDDEYIKSYYNDNLELNAYYQQTMDALSNVSEAEKATWKNGFDNLVKSINKLDIIKWDKLTDKNKKKYKTRLYNFWIDYISGKKVNETVDYIDDEEVLIDPTYNEFRHFMKRNTWYRAVITNDSLAIWNGNNGLIHSIIDKEYDLTNSTHIFVYNGIPYYIDYDLNDEDYAMDMKDDFISACRDIDNNPVYKKYFPNYSMEKHIRDAYENGGHYLEEGKQNNKKILDESYFYDYNNTFYYTTSPNTFLTIIKNKFKGIPARVYYDFNKKLFVFSDARYVIHSQLMYYMTLDTNVYKDEEKNWDKDFYHEGAWQEDYLMYHYLKRNAAMFQIIWDTDVDSHDWGDKYIEGYWAKYKDFYIICRDEEYRKCNKIPLFYNLKFWSQKYNNMKTSKLNEWWSGGINWTNDMSGLGAVSATMECKYFFFMFPDQFLNLCPKFSYGDEKFFTKYILSKKPVGIPFLWCEIDNENKTIKVFDHEGRHRVKAIRDYAISRGKSQPDIPVAIIYNKDKYSLPLDINELRKNWKIVSQDGKTTYNVGQFTVQNNLDNARTKIENLYETVDVNVYHGSPNVFKKFDKRKLGTSTNKFEDEKYSSTDYGFFFTNDKEYASGYGENNYKCNIKLNNPLVVDMSDYIATEDVLVKFLQQAKNENKDGVVFKNIREVGRNPSTEYVVFNPDNIKIEDTLTESKLNDKFWKWFKGSKVVDDSGNPLVVYHGTKDKFDVFEFNSFNKFDSGYAGTGFYFSNSTEVAQDYADWKKGRNNPIIMPVYLSIKNPLIVSSKGSGVKLAVQKALGMKVDDSPFGISKQISDEMTKIAKSKGYDGIIDNTSKGDMLFVVFEPNQIKSVDNDGDWSPDNNNIKESVDKIDILKNPTRKELLNSNLSWCRYCYDNNGNYYFADANYTHNDIMLNIKGKLGIQVYDDMGFYDVDENCFYIRIYFNDKEEYDYYLDREKKIKQSSPLLKKLFGNFDVKIFSGEEPNVLNESVEELDIFKNPTLKELKKYDVDRWRLLQDTNGNYYFGDAFKYTHDMMSNKLRRIGIDAVDANTDNAGITLYNVLTNTFYYRLLGIIDYEDVVNEYKTSYLSKEFPNADLEQMNDDKEELDESVNTQYLYHAMWKKQFVYCKKEGKLFGHDAYEYAPNNKKVRGRKLYGISTSRNLNVCVKLKEREIEEMTDEWKSDPKSYFAMKFKDDGTTHYIDKGADLSFVVLVFDYNKLKQNHKIVPYSYVGGTMRDTFGDEQEEIVIGDIPNFMDYVVNVIEYNNNVNRKTLKSKDLVESKIWSDVLEKYIDDPDEPSKPEYKGNPSEVAIKIFGTTNNPNECGYILTDGKMLDFSEKRNGGQRGTRNADHRQIMDIGMDMFDFCNLGNIRYMPESNWFMICKLPTEQQFRIISAISRMNDGEIMIECMKDANDWGNSNKTFEKEYMFHTPFAKIRRDIENYFKE